MKAIITECALYIRSHAWQLFILSIAVVLTYMAASFSFIQKYSADTYSLNDDIPAQRVAIVFGSGVTDDGPTPALQDRLDTAQALLENNIVEKLLLSGDNRTLDYNEPRVMQQYLVDRGVMTANLQQDLAGRSTYETCERANKIFGLDTAILITQETHVPRAMYLCEHFGIESTGVVAEGNGSTARRQFGQNFREIFARSKAIFNANIYGEKTVLGDPINF